jgi:hypothetical protein
MSDFKTFLERLGSRATALSSSQAQELHAQVEKIAHVLYAIAMAARIKKDSSQQHHIDAHNHDRKIDGLTSDNLADDPNGCQPITR